ncbi:MAG: hypothetical protein ACREYE_32725 [Gammaproteobacteria bacterium]
MQLDTFIFRIKQPIELAAAGVHLTGHLGLGHTLGFHGFSELPRDHAFDRHRLHAFVDAFLSQSL